MKKGNYVTNHLFSIIGVVFLAVAAIGSFLTFRIADGQYVNPYAKKGSDPVVLKDIKFSIYDGSLQEMRVVAVIFLLLTIACIVFLLKGDTGIATIFGVGVAILAVVMQFIVSNTTVKNYSVIAEKPEGGKAITLQYSNEFKPDLDEGDTVLITYSFLDPTYDPNAENVTNEETGFIPAERQGGTPNKPIRFTVGTDESFPELAKELLGTKFGNGATVSFDYKVPETVEEMPDGVAKYIFDGNEGRDLKVLAQVDCLQGYEGDKTEVRFDVYLQKENKKNSADVAQNGRTGIGSILMMLGACVGALCTVVALNKNE